MTDPLCPTWPEYIRISCRGEGNRIVRVARCYICAALLTEESVDVQLVVHVSRKWALDANSWGQVTRTGLTCVLVI